jgi:hypothetical protein
VTPGPARGGVEYPRRAIGTFARWRPADDYRVRYLGVAAPGYAFYRIALADVVGVRALEPE